MNPSLNSVHQWIIKEVSRVSSERGVSQDRAFSAWSLHFVNQIDLDDAFDQSAAFDAPIDTGIHGWYRDEESSELQIWHSSWSTDTAHVFDSVGGARTLRHIDNILNNSPPKIDSLYNFPAAALRAAAAHDYEITLCIAAPTSFSKIAIEELSQIALQIEHKHKVRLSVSVIDGLVFDNQTYEQRAVQESLKGEKVEFTVTDNKTIELEPPTIPIGWRAALANIEGGSLAQIAKRYGMRLFHMNVRYALPHKQKRIQSIRKTLSTPEDAQRFWLYNNGLTILCDSFSTSPRSKNIIIENPQVVNGCQTVTAFRVSLDKHASSASVLARIICPPNIETTTQAALISERTNSQTPVLARDLKSNDRVQKRLQIAMERLVPKWFYEIKRGEWAAVASSKQSQYQDGSKRVVDIEQIGQSYRMLYEPAEAVTRKKALFEDEDIYGRVFAPNRAAEVYIFAELLRRHFTEFWRKDNIGQIQIVCGEIIDEKMLNRLMRAKNQVVGHCVALTAMLFDWSENWDERAARAAYKHLASGGVNLAPWLRHIGISLSGTIQLIDAIAAEVNKTAHLEEPTGIKKHFERPQQKTLIELWKRISGNAQLLTGPEWRGQLLKQVIPS